MQGRNFKDKNIIFKFFDNSTNSKIDAGSLQFHSNDFKDLDFSCKFELLEAQGNEPYWIVTLVSQTDVHWKNIYIYDEFIIELKRVFSKNKCELVFLTRELSKYYSEKLYPLFHDFEIGLRQTLHLSLSFSMGQNWDARLFEEQQLKKKKDSIKSKSSEHIIEEFDLTTLTNFLLNKTIINFSKEGNNSLVSIDYYEKTEDLILDLIKYEGDIKLTSLWKAIIVPQGFNHYSEEILAKKFKKLKHIRNNIAHNKRIRFKEYTESRDFLVEFNSKLSYFNDELSKNRTESLKLFSSIDFSKLIALPDLSKNFLEISKVMGDTIRNLSANMTDYSNLFSAIYGMNDSEQEVIDDIDEDDIDENDIDENEEE